MNIWFTLVYQPVLNLLAFTYQAVGQNLGIAIIVVTALTRLILFPLTIPSLKSTQKMQELKPELDKLKDKYKNDKQAFAQAQLKLFQEHKINPLSGLLPTILQFVFIFALFSVFSNVLKQTDLVGVANINKELYSFVQISTDSNLNTKFLYLDLEKPDTIANFLGNNNFKLGFLSADILPGPILLIAVLTQYLSTKLISSLNSKKNKLEIKKNEIKKEDDMATSMQKQLMVIGPIMTLVIGIRFASGIVLYWVVISLSLIFQQIYLNQENKKQAKA